MRCFPDVLPDRPLLEISKSATFLSKTSTRIGGVHLRASYCCVPWRQIAAQSVNNVADVLLFQ
ncbi:hypothetical protein KCP77_00395 [Salmonella enterica subsp. enterica]|nr:hypothetical protein KCP77_00395 [Salmonella enterica subsp. enterica]